VSTSAVHPSFWAVHPNHAAKNMGELMMAMLCKDRTSLLRTDIAFFQAGSGPLYALPAYISRSARAGRLQSSWFSRRLGRLRLIPALRRAHHPGDAPQLLLLRAPVGAGPAGVGDPVLTLLARNERTVLATNDNWSVSATGARAIEAALTRLSLPAMSRGARDAALLVRLSPGEYVFKVMGKARTWERATVEAQFSA